MAMPRLLVLSAALASAPARAEEAAAIWDFIVVGAGTGGGLCAGRLAAAGASVLLLEAGSWDRSELYDSGYKRNVAENRWAHPAELPHPLTVQNDLDMRQKIAVGHIMGGTSAIHGDLYDRPPDKEFEYKGIRSWDAATIKDAFDRIEQDLNFTWIGDESLDAVPDAQYWVIDKLISGIPLEHHPRAPRGGPKGGLSVGWWMYRSCPPGVPTGLKSLGEPRCRRHTSYSDFVGDRNASLPGLAVLDGALAARVLLEGSEAVGVEVLRRGRRHEAFARYGVVLAAGALGTPKILTLSGVGDPLDLQRLGVPVQVANREVGQGLSDHLATYTWFMLRGGSDELLQGDNCKHGEKFNLFLNTTGPPTGGDGPVDAEIRLFTGCNISRGTIDFGLEAVILSPESRGRVHVASARPQDASIAHFPALWESDFQRLEELLSRFAEAVGLVAKDLVADKGETLSESIRNKAYLYQHFCCSARVAPDGQPGVCDERLRVRGVGGLYVADASALPFLPSSHTSAAALLVGELASRTAMDAYRSGRQQPLPPRAAEGAGRGARAALLAEGEDSRDFTPPPKVQLRVPAGAEPVGLPLIGLGTGTIRTHRVAEAVASFLRLGGRHIDTAVMYDNYAAIRAGIERSGLGEPSELVITSKMMPLGRQAVREAVSAARAGLGRPRLEVALLHWPGDVPGGKLLHGAPLPPCVDEAGSWARCRRESYDALAELQQAGLVAAIGVSNFALKHLDELAASGHEPPAVHQLELSPSWHEEELLERSARDGTQLQAFGCLGGAFAGAPLLRQEGFRKIATRRGISSAQVLLRWAVELGASVVSGGSSDAHLEENMRIFDFSLNAEEMDFMSSMDRPSMSKMYGPEPSLIP